MTPKDPYEILGVAKSATADEIKRVYRRLAKEHHPDRNPGNKKAEERFKEIQAAYDVLGDPQRRAEFDRFGAGGPAPNYQNWSQGGHQTYANAGVDFSSIGDLGSIFEAFFSRGGAATANRSRARRGRPATQPRPATPDHTLEISFEESALGATRELLLQDGDAQEHIEIRIPKGVADGQVIRVRGKGQHDPDGRGDLLIRVRVRPHPMFRREGLDVLLDLPLSIPEAVLGAKVEIPTLDGRAHLSVPPGASSGMRLRLRGRGFSRSDGETGDMYAVVKIVAPRDPSAKLKEIVQAEAAEFGPNPRSGLGWGP